MIQKSSTLNQPSFVSLVLIPDTYHVVPGKVMSTDLTDDMMAKTVEGADVKIDLDSGVMVNDANVVTADIVADNGVIHVIDKVIMPPM
jgi:uncharacterized surface protein with fasciclin (FAS1) repeats